MGIFRRKSQADTVDPADQDPRTDQSGQHSSSDDEAGLAGEAVFGASADDGPVNARTLRGSAGAEAAPPAYHRTDGPFDVTEVAGPDGRLDLGALWVTGLPGMELRLDMEQDTQTLIGVTAVLGESALQLQVFAAPRTAGVWEDIRTEIAASITSQGGTAEDTDGPLGTELRARMPGQGPDGRTVYSPARFLGIDGPRWFLRGVLSGRAAVDPDSAHALLDVLKATVVVRGDEAMAPRDMLPLRLPQEALADPADLDGEDQLDDENQLDDADRLDGADRLGAATKDAPSQPRRIDDLRPFERGPEITEVR